MKKITFLAFLLVASFGFSQELITNGDFQDGTTGAPFYSGGENNPIEVVDLGGGNLAYRSNNMASNAAEAWRINLSQVVALEDNTTYELVFDAFTAVGETRTILTSLGQAGPGFNGTDTQSVTLTENSQTFSRIFTTNFDTANAGSTTPGSRVIFDMNNETGFVFIDNVSLQEVDPTLVDVSLSALEIDNVPIEGFDPNTTSYTINLTSATPVPQVTLATATNTNAQVSAITQAMSVPGTATFDVTSEDMSVTQTYTINFALLGMPVNLVDNPGFETGDFTGWQQFESTPGNQTVTMTNPSSGTFAANINNVTGATNSLIKSANKGVGVVAPNQPITVRFDMRGSGAAGGVTFVELFSELSGGGVSSAAILGGGPIPLNGDPDVWTSYEFMATLGPDVSGGVTLQIGAVTGGDPASFMNIWVDNVEMEYTPTLSLNSVTSNFNVKIYPNPTVNNWIIESSNNQNITSVKVYDILGKEVLSMNPNAINTIIDASSMKSGIYLAKLSTVNGTKTVRLIKQ